MQQPGQKSSGLLGLLSTVLQGTLVTRPLKDRFGYTFSLASRLGNMLAEAQKRFGPREPSFTFLGIEFEADGPRTWYPVPERKNVIVQLSLEALCDEHRAVFQLAHECVHLLSPAFPGQASWLEEGLATRFSVDYMHAVFRIDCSSWLSPTYAEAMAAVDQLLVLDPAVIRTLRAREPVISRITAQALREACPSLPEEVAHRLASPSGKMR